MPAIEAPQGLPCPQTSTVTPEERRLLTESQTGPRQARTIELDERQVQVLSWTLSSDEAAIFKTWWRETLTYGGAWFSAPATWPTPEGVVVKVRRFIEAPQWAYAGVGVWRVSAVCEVRGETELPQTPSTVPDGLWRDTFSGTAGTPLSSHSQDVPLLGSVWVFNPGGVVEPELDGSGSATAVASGNGWMSDILTYFGGEAGTGVQLNFPYTLELDFEGLWQQPDSESGGYSTVFELLSYYGFGLTVTWVPGLATLETPAEVSFSEGEGAYTMSNTVQDGLNQVSVLIEADGYTPTLNGVTGEKQSFLMPANVYRFYMRIGSSYAFAERVAPFSTVSRTELIGSISA